MEIAVTELKWFQFRERLIDWRKKRHDDQLVTVSDSEERSISILQKRYGLPREQAIFQLRRYYSHARLE